MVLIVRLQKCLNSKWGPYQFRAKVLIPDGTFGKNTAKAVQVRATTENEQQHPPSTTRSPPAHLLARQVYLNQFFLEEDRALEVDGTQNSLMVRTLQQYLMSKGHTLPAATGAWDHETITALKDYLKKEGF